MWANLRERRPGQTLAIMPEPDAELLAETLVAFANSDGGAILIGVDEQGRACLLYTSPSPRDLSTSRMPSSA